MSIRKMTELQAFEFIARKIHLDGQSSIMEGNPCSSAVSVLFYLEQLLIEQGTPSALVSALSDDLDKHNKECIEFCGGRYGYDD